MGKTIKIDPVTRIEGHARVMIDTADDGSVENAYMIVNELRGFERILVGMEADKMPLITARICGVCPTAHHLAAVKALDHAAGAEPPPAAKKLRELMYMGHFIHSHALSLFVLSGPDLLFGIDGPPAHQNVVGMVAAQPEVTKRALRLRTLGQKINEIIGGRGVHPVTAVAGGVSCRLGDEQFDELRSIADECLTLAPELGAVAKQLLGKQLEEHPDLLQKMELPTWYMGTVADGMLNFYDGKIRVMANTGEIKTEFDIASYADFINERAVDWSYMKEVFFNFQGEEQLYRVNPLARVNVCDTITTPQAQTELTQFREQYGRPCHNTVLQIYARLIELIYACERARELANDPDIRGESRVPMQFKAGRGIGHVEAPRGTLIHDYEIDSGGIIRSANLIVATQQNYAAINRSLKQAADKFIAQNDEAVLNGLEYTIRCYDPCLSCATHAIGQMDMDVEIRNNGTVTRRIGRK